MDQPPRPQHHTRGQSACMRFNSRARALFPHMKPVRPAALHMNISQSNKKVERYAQSCNQFNKMPAIQWHIIYLRQRFSNPEHAATMNTLLRTRVNYSRTTHTNLILPFKCPRQVLSDGPTSSSTGAIMFAPPAQIAPRQHKCPGEPEHRTRAQMRRSRTSTNNCTCWI